MKLPIVKSKPKAARLVCLLPIVVGILFLSGCSPFVDSDQTWRDEAIEIVLKPGATVGQTFVARHSGLNGIEVWLAPAQAGQGNLRLSLMAEPGDRNLLASVALPVASITRPGFYRFPLPLLRDSHSRYYYGVLELEGNAALYVGAAPSPSYLDGSLYLNDAAVAAQMAFRLTYDRGSIVLDLARFGLWSAAMLLAAGLLFLVPGWTVLRLLYIDRQKDFGLDFGDRLGLAAGLSLALHPLLMLWTHVLGWQLGSWYAWGPGLGGLAVLVGIGQPWRRLSSLRCIVRARVCRGIAWTDPALVAVVLVVLAVRLLVIRTLEAPLWGDSVQHAVIARLINDHGGLFSTWEPYAPYGSLTVQYGFSVATALLTWITRFETAQATLLAGQLVNGLAIIALYPLSRRLARGNQWAGIGTIIVAGLLMSMPAYYVNWGRYAQLTGQAILPVALWFLWDLLDQRRLSWQGVGLACISLSGLALSYYRMPFYYAAFVVAWLLFWALPQWRTDLRLWGAGMLRLTLIALGAFLLFLPWMLRIQDSTLSAGLNAGVGSVAPIEAVRAEYLLWRDIENYVPLAWLLTSLVALAWAVIYKQRSILLVGLWTGIMASLVAGRLIGLPGANYLQTFALLIALYIPTGLLSGWLIGEFVGCAARHWPRIAPPLMAGVILTLAVWGAKGQVGIINPQHIMVTRPDSQAMAWIRENTPPNARFLVEGFLIYDGRSAVGADAGWWIPLLGERANTMPPQYALLNEVPTAPGYNQQVVALIRTLTANPPATPAALRALCEAGVTHVYIGQTQGLTGFGVTQLFTPEHFIAQPAFRLVYQKDRVYIFALVEGACETTAPLS